MTSLVFNDVFPRKSRNRRCQTTGTSPLEILDFIVSRVCFAVHPRIPLNCNMIPLRPSCDSPHDVAAMRSTNSSAVALSFVLTSVSNLRLCSRRGTCMTAGQVGGADQNKSPTHAPNPPSLPPAKKVEKRPEVVGGVPLWLTVGLADQIRRLSERLRVVPFAARRRDAMAKVEQTLVQSEESDEEAEFPVGRAMRKMADIMEEEMTSLRTSMASMKAELVRSRHETVRARNKLDELKGEYARRRSRDSERALAMTAKQLRLLHAREQTRATAAEKKLRAVRERLEVVERRNKQLEQDMVKGAMMYAAVGVVVVGFLLESPLWAAFVERLKKGGG